jgi:RNA polymerase sigma factor (sigma-70 family)
VTSRNQPRNDAFVELIQAHTGILQKVARAYCPMAAQRQDLIQEMTIALWRSFDRYDPSRSFSTWTYRIAFNVAISFFRSDARHTQRRAALDQAPASLENAPDDPRVALLLECIDELGPLDKALVLMHLDGYPHAEIADVLGITPTNAATKLGRIKDRLRRAMTALTTNKGTTNGTR